jgi:hypothetical protein
MRLLPLLPLLPLRALIPANRRRGGKGDRTQGRQSVLCNAGLPFEPEVTAVPSEALLHELTAGRIIAAASIGERDQFARAAARTPGRADRALRQAGTADRM